MYVFGGLSCERDDQNQFIPCTHNDFYSMNLEKTIASGDGTDTSDGSTLLVWKREEPAGDVFNFFFLLISGTVL